MAYTWVDPVPEEVVEALRGDYQLGLFFRLNTETVLRWWMGVGDVPAGIDSIDVDTLYLGGGRLLGVPTLEALFMGKSDKVEFTLSGVDVLTAQQVIAEIPEVRGADVHVGITTLDQYYQPMSAIIPLWKGTASHVRKVIPPVVTGARSTTLSLIVTGGSNTRSRAARVFWTKAHHQSKYPTDKFCNGTPRLGRGVAPSWPRF